MEARRQRRDCPTYESDSPDLEATVVEADADWVFDGAADGAEPEAVAGLAVAGGFGGAGFSGLIPPSQDGPEYISAESPLAFHFSSKSAAALFGDSPIPTTPFQG